MSMSDLGFQHRIRLQWAFNISSGKSLTKKHGVVNDGVHCLQLSNSGQSAYDCVS